MTKEGGSTVAKKEATVSVKVLLGVVGIVLTCGGILVGNSIATWRSLGEVKGDSQSHWREPWHDVAGVHISALEAGVSDTKVNVAKLDTTIQMHITEQREQFGRVEKQLDKVEDLIKNGS